MAKMIDTPAGPFFIDDDATPEAIAAARADFIARNRNTAKQSDGIVHGSGAAGAVKNMFHDREVDRRVNSRLPGLGIASKAMQGVTGSFMDEIAGALSAGTRGTVNAIRKGDVGEIGKEYRLARDTERTAVHQNDGMLGTAAEIAGSLVNPIGTGAKGLQALRFAPRLVRAGKALEEAPAVVQAVTAGGLNGGINAAGADESGTLGGTISHAGQGALVGSVFGGAIGGAATGVRRGAQIIADRAPAAADRVAYGKIGQMLDKAGTSPAQAERELAVTKARGGDPMLMDMSPGLRAQAGALSRRPDLPASNDMIERGEQRILDRPGKFEAEIRKRITPATGVDADAHLSGIDAARKAQGAADYPSVLNKQFVWNDELEKFVKEAPAPTRAALKDAVNLVLHERKDPTALGMGFDADGNVVFQKVPSMRAFDYMKRAFDQHIQQAYKAGDNNTARILSGELDTLKAGIGKSNPEYQNVLSKQRDYYQRAEATQLGLDVMARMKREPKKVMAELQVLDPSKREDARTGIADAIIAMRSQKADPVSYFASIARTPEQRKVLEFAFDGKGNLARFQRWMDRELRAKKADVLTAPGRQSETDRFKQASDSLGGGIGDVFEHAGRGFAFGGPAGATAAVFRKFNDLRTGMSPSALDAMAKALMGDGSGVAGKVSSARTYAKVRKLRNAKYAVKVAKGAQQPLTDYAGD